MSINRAASRYAKSIMELSLEKGCLEEVHADFQKLSTLAESNYELALVLKNPIVNSEKKLSILKALFAKGAQEITLTFFDIVSRKNREAILLDVAKEFVIQYNIHSSIQVAYLTTTFAIDDVLRKTFIEIVKEISGLSEVQLVEKIDPELIGGYIIKVNDRLLDDSLSTKLRILKTQFSKNQYEKKF